MADRTVNYNFDGMADVDLVILRHKLAKANCDSQEAVMLVAVEKELAVRDHVAVEKPIPIHDPAGELLL